MAVRSTMAGTADLVGPRRRPSRIPPGLRLPRRRARQPRPAHRRRSPRRASPRGDGGPAAGRSAARTAAPVRAGCGPRRGRPAHRPPRRRWPGGTRAARRRTRRWLRRPDRPSRPSRPVGRAPALRGIPRPAATATSRARRAHRGRRGSGPGEAARAGVGGGHPRSPEPSRTGSPGPATTASTPQPAPAGRDFEPPRRRHVTHQATGRGVTVRAGPAVEHEDVPPGVEGGRVEPTVAGEVRHRRLIAGGAQLPGQRTDDDAVALGMGDAAAGRGDADAGGVVVGGRAAGRDVAVGSAAPGAAGPVARSPVPPIGADGGTVVAAIDTTASGPGAGARVVGASAARCRRWCRSARRAPGRSARPRRGR